MESGQPPANESRCSKPGWQPTNHSPPEHGLGGKGAVLLHALKTGLSWGFPRGSASAEMQELAAMAVNSAVAVLQLCRGIITKVCDPGLSCQAHPGTKVLSQQDVAI